MVERTIVNPSRGREQVHGLDTEAKAYRDLPGNEQVNQSEMLALLAQKTDLSSSGRAPPELQNAIRRGAAARNLADDQEFDLDNPPPPPPMPEQRAMPQNVRDALPEKIREKMDAIDRARANPDAMREATSRRAQPAPEPEPEPVENRGPQRPARRQVITNQPDAPRPQPVITEQERAEFRATRPPEPVIASTPTKPRFIRKAVNRVPQTGYQRVELVSGFVFYPFKELRVRKFNIDDGLLIEAAKRKQSVSHVIDAVGNSLDAGVDVRDLTFGDFRQLMYWHRFNSYASYPLDYSWVSRYSNRQNYRITNTDLQYNTLKTDEQELQAWLDQGYTCPRVRDFELFAREQLDEEDAFLASRAQYFVGFDAEDGGPPDIQDKIDMMNEKCAESLDAILQINNWSKMIEHGVRETVLLRDALFDPVEYVKRLEQERAEYERQIEALRPQAVGDEEIQQTLFLLGVQNESITQEIEKYSQEGAAADIEEVSLDIPLLDFFPNL